MRLTVLIATCDRPSTLAVTLEAVAISAARFSGSASVMVVDNGTGQPAGVTVAEASARTGVAMRCIRSPIPRNKCAALNAGIAAIETEWIAFTDDDTVPDPDWLVKGAAYAKTCGCRYFGARILPGDFDLRMFPWWARQDRTGCTPRTEGIFVHFEPQQTSGVLLPSDSVPLGANVFARRDVFNNRGGYDEGLWAICGRAALGVDDGEFGVRLKQRGEPIGYCHEALVVHPVHAERCSLSRQFRLNFYYGWRDPLVFFLPDRPAIEPYRFRLLARLAGQTIGRMLLFRRAEALTLAFSFSRVLGCMVSRWSAAYQRRLKHVSPGAVGAC